MLKKELKIQKRNVNGWLTCGHYLKKEKKESEIFQYFLKTTGNYTNFTYSFLSAIPFSGTDCVGPTVRPEDGVVVCVEIHSVRADSLAKGDNYV